MVYLIELLDKFRADFAIPSWVILEEPPYLSNLFSLAKGHWFPSLFVSECGFSFPPNPLCLEFCQYFDIIPARITPNTWRIVNGVHRLNQIHGTHLGIPGIMYYYKWVTSDTTFYLKTRFSKRALVVNLPDANRDYFDQGVVMKNWKHPSLKGKYVYQGPRCPPYGNGIGCFYFFKLALLLFDKMHH